MADETKGGRELEVIGYAPTDGLTYDPADSEYWDKAALDQELERTFEICLLASSLTRGESLC